MKRAEWQPEWLQQTVTQLVEPEVWRGVETQYISSTTFLVETLGEQEVLERLLDQSKPPPPPLSQGQHFLLYTPFRYTPQHPSRFRVLGHLGIWYGARELEAACAEVAYWRMRFILDSVGLAKSKIVTRHTFFAAKVEGAGIDLMAPPWKAFEEAWKSNDYEETHRLAEAVEATSIQVIRYESVRAPGCSCVAVLAPAALSEPRKGIDATRQQWTCTATHSHVMMAQDAGPGRFEWDC